MTKDKKSFMPEIIISLSAAAQIAIRLMPSETADELGIPRDDHPSDAERAEMLGKFARMLADVMVLSTIEREMMISRIKEAAHG